MKACGMVEEWGWGSWQQPLSHHLWHTHRGWKLTWSVCTSWLMNRPSPAAMPKRSTRGSSSPSASSTAYFWRGGNSSCWAGTSTMASMTLTLRYLAWPGNSRRPWSDLPFVLPPIAVALGYQVIVWLAFACLLTGALGGLTCRSLYCVFDGLMLLHSLQVLDLDVASDLFPPPPPLIPSWYWWLAPLLSQTDVDMLMP